MIFLRFDLLTSNIMFHMVVTQKLNRLLIEKKMFVVIKNKWNERKVMVFWTNSKIADFKSKRSPQVDLNVILLMFRL